MFSPAWIATDARKRINWRCSNGGDAAESDGIRAVVLRKRDEARADVFDYIEVFYNRTRRHSHLGMQSPYAFEQALKAGQ